MEVRSSSPTHSNGSDVDSIELKFSILDRRAQDIQARHVRQIVVSALVGCLGMVALGAASRMWTRAVRQSRHPPAGGDFGYYYAQTRQSSQDSDQDLTPAGDSGGSTWRSNGDRCAADLSLAEIREA
jgi:hypothetical protein